MYNRYLSTIGKECRNAREMRNLTIDQVCYDLGWNYYSLQRFESGKYQLSHTRLEALLKYLKIRFEVKTVTTSFVPDHLRLREDGSLDPRKRGKWNIETGELELF